MFNFFHFATCIVKVLKQHFQFFQIAYIVLIQRNVQMTQISKIILNKQLFLYFIFYVTIVMIT